MQSVPWKKGGNAVCLIMFERERGREKESESEFGKEKCLGSFADNTTVRQSQGAGANGTPMLESSRLTIYCTRGTAYVIFIHFFS